MKTNVGWNGLTHLAAPAAIATRLEKATVESGTATDQSIVGVYPHQNQVRHYRNGDRCFNSRNTGHITYLSSLYFGFS